MYFNRLPEMLYNFPFADGEKIIVVRDITANVRVLKQTLENIALFDQYDIIDGETPEIVSAKWYDTPKYHWALMIANQRFDYVNDWPLTYTALQQYCIDKYGADNIYAIHHHEDANGYVVNDDVPLATPISNIAHEEAINESKRRIRIISKDLLQQLTDEFNKIFSV